MCDFYHHRKVVDAAAKEAGAGTLPPSHELMDNIYLVSSIVEAEGGKSLSGFFLS